MTITSQLDLFIRPTRLDRIDVWLRSDAAKPLIRAFIDEAEARLAHGQTDLRAKQIAEDLRDRSDVAGDPDGHGFRFDNTLTSRLVRRVVELRPDVREHFVLRGDT